MALGGVSRGLLIASLFFGLSYPLIWNLGWPEAASTAGKGAGVALLALAAAIEARDGDGWRLTAVMGFGALGDILLVSSMTTGAIAFVIGHIIAIWLYLRNRRARLSPSQRALALVVIPGSVLIAWLLPADRAQAPGVAIYALFVAAMAAAAWISRFPRYRTGIGAMMFLASDLFIFARMGPLEGAAWAGLVIWLLYYVGQMLIALGVLGEKSGWRVDQSVPAE
ncbi:lysoplasmalogenase [Sphingomonas sp. LaA6.9]|uniref:lysoplasmalogenase n=1 Tax=Sphingomonas sp. LaA6.9 TaxID=2919914 RepID=UPI001F4F144A|nr:lysoplasmalogenase [Sphingomonas sp. LaA6.9]MCJ8156201.1 lysoplasmalogenase [Sphingomonas sp. LaA6.9]